MLLIDDSPVECRAVPAITRLHRGRLALAGGTSPLGSISLARVYCCCVTNGNQHAQCWQAAHSRRGVKCGLSAAIPRADERASAK